MHAGELLVIGQRRGQVLEPMQIFKLVEYRRDPLWTLGVVQPGVVPLAVIMMNDQGLH